MTLNPLQTLRFRAFLDEAKMRDCAIGLLATITPRDDATSGKTVVELRIGAFSRETAHKIQQLIRQEVDNGPMG